MSYTPPLTDAVDFEFGGAYTPPAVDEITFSFQPIPAVGALTFDDVTVTANLTEYPTSEILVTHFEVLPRLMRVHVGGRRVNIARGSFRIDFVAEERTVGSFIVDDDLADVDVEQGTPVEIFDGIELVCSGFAELVHTRIKLPDIARHLVVSFKDWHYVADKRGLIGEWSDIDAGDVVLDRIAEILEEEGVTVTADTVFAGAHLSAVVFSYGTSVAAALDALAERSGYTWWIDPEPRLFFLPPGEMQVLDPLRWDHVDGGAPDVEHGSAQYRNHQMIVAGRDITDPQTETFRGDGETSTFTVAYPLAAVPTVSVGESEQTVGIREVDADDEFDWYWQSDSAQISQRRGDSPLETTDVLQIIYRGFYPVVVAARDQNEVNRLNTLEGTSGIVEDVARIPALTSRQQAFDIIAGKLNRYARPDTVISLRTRRRDLTPGYQIRVHLPEVGLPNHLMHIHTATLRDIDGLLYSDVTLGVNPKQPSAYRFFTPDLDALRVGITEGETLLILDQVDDTATVTEQVTVTEYDVLFPGSDIFPGSDTFPGG